MWTLCQINHLQRTLWSAILSTLVYNVCKRCQNMRYVPLIVLSWPRGYKTLVQSLTQNKAQWLAACGHVSASSQSLRCILSLRMNSSFIYLCPTYPKGYGLRDILFLVQILSCALFNINSLNIKKKLCANSLCCTYFIRNIWSELYINEGMKKWNNYYRGNYLPDSGHHDIHRH